MSSVIIKKDKTNCLFFLIVITIVFNNFFTFKNTDI